MNNKILKGTFSAALAVCALSVAAQLPVAGEHISHKQHLSSSSLKALRAASPVNAINQKGARLAAPRVMQTQEAVDVYNVMTRDTPSKPGAFYSVDAGYYNLVPGFALTILEDDSVVYARRGILGYPDRDLHFANRSKEGTFSAFEWDFDGDKFSEDTVLMHPYFANNGVYLNTPKLTATMNGVDSVYQMGYSQDYVDQTKFLPGMVALSRMAYVYNVDVDAAPFVNTFYSALSPTDPWGNGNMLFGWDTDMQPAYVELFDAPKDGAVVLWGTHFYVLTPTTVDLGKKRFTVSWAEYDSKKDEWVLVKEFKDVKAKLDRDLSTTTLRVWEVAVNTETPECLVNSSFYVMIDGPQDGTKWALLSQLDRMDFTDSERNTAYYVPKKGEYAGQMCQYVLQLQNGNEVVDFNYASSLDIHQYVATPYMIMCKDNARLDFVQDTNYDFSIDGETQKYLILDWLGGASNDVTVSATVSNSSDGDWFTVTQPVEAEGKSNLFAISMTAQAKPWNVKGRRATLTLTDNKGFSRDLTIYQGDRSAADDALSVEAVNASGRVDVTAAGEGFDVIYPSSYNRLDVYATSGQLVGTYALSAGGSAHIAAASWQKGIYVFQFAGNEGTQVVKVLKK